MDHPVRNVLFGFLSVIVIFGIGLGVYFTVYGTAETRGRIALHNQQRSPAELQASYEYFHNTCNDIIAKNHIVVNLQDQLKNEQANPPANDPFGQNASKVSQLQDNISGTQNIRDTEAAQYNAKSHEFTHNFMKSKDLPDEIGAPNGVPFATLVCEGS